MSASAAVDIEPDAGGGFSISLIRLVTKAEVPDLDAQTFAKCAEAAKNGFPLSKALAAVEITLEAHLVAAATS